MKLMGYGWHGRTTPTPSDTLGNTIGSDENLHKALRVSKNMGKSLDLSENLRRL